MGEFLGSHGEAAPRREGLRERILGRDVLAAVAAQRLLLLGAGGQRLGPLLRQVLLVLMLQQPAKRIVVSRFSA